jgi:hypothetical protein
MPAGVARAKGRLAPIRCRDRGSEDGRGGVRQPLAESLPRRWAHGRDHAGVVRPGAVARPTRTNLHANWGQVQRP